MAANTSGQDWQADITDFQQRLEVLRTRAHFQDVNFRVEVHHPYHDGIEVQNFGAHKVLLASSSPVFAEYFYKDGHSNTGDTSNIKITDVSHKAFELMLRYIYGQPVKFDPAYLALQTYEAAKKYKIKQLEDMASEHLQSCNLSPVDVVCVLDNDCHTEIRGLHQKCLDVAGDKPLEVIRLAAETGKRKTINLLLQMERLSVSSELALFKELIEGIKSRKIDQLHDHAKIHLIRSFLHNIRFLTMTPQEFSISLSLCGPAIRQGEGYAILRLLSHPESGNFPLPSWCSKLTNSRINQARNVLELDLLPSYAAYRGEKFFSSPEDTNSLISSLEIKAHGGRFVFTGVSLAYRRFASEFENSESVASLPMARCTLNIRNNSAGVAYERVVNLRLDGRSTFLQFPVPLPVSAKEEAKVSVILEGNLQVEFSHYVMKRHMAGNESEGFQVFLDNCRVSDGTFAIAKLYYV